MKKVVKNYYLGDINDPKILSSLSKTFDKTFINNKDAIKLQVKNEINLINSDTYSIIYLAKLLNRVRLEKGLPKSEKWTDEEIRDVVKQYNDKDPVLPGLERYSESIYNNLNALRDWLD